FCIADIVVSARSLHLTALITISYVRAARRVDTKYYPASYDTNYYLTISGTPSYPTDSKSHYPKERGMLLSR
ncbi:MAG: hypothetical protein ACO3XO_10330, partial [Bdellovibrionota bacterium]